MLDDLIGIWKVLGIDMVPDRTLSLIGGLPGQVVEFTADGNYINWGPPSRPDPSVSHYRGHPSDPPALDIWIPGLEPLQRLCIYRVQGSIAEICVTGNAGPRPFEIRRDDERLWALIRLEKWTGPPLVAKRKRRSSFKPGKFIPEGFLDLLVASRRQGATS